MKIVTIIGARPQFIKAAAVSRAIADHNAQGSDVPIEEVIVHTGQHYDVNMSQIFFEELHIPQPHYNLEVGSGNHGATTGAMLAKIEEVLLNERPDFVMVYGDTNSTLAGALAAVKLHISTIHIEAGLRSYNRYMPEEINRIVTDQAANLLLCPTTLAVDNLKSEGISEGSESGEIGGSCDFNRQQVFNVGDVMYDSVLFNSRLAADKSTLLGDLDLEGMNYALATLHRAENTDNPDRLAQIIASLQAIAEQHLPVVLPLHPRTRKVIAQAGLDLTTPGLRVIDPVGYLDMLNLEKQARLILTDSGGVQKEAYFMRVPCITMRQETEWVETVNMGWNYLAGASSVKIRNAVQSALSIAKGSPPFVQKLASTEDMTPYGEGDAAQKIVQILVTAAQEPAQLMEG